MCSNIGTTKTINFPFGTNGKLMVLDVHILKHFRVLYYSIGSNSSIPELLRQHSSEKLQKPTRPASASIRKTRPPSGKKPRPQSAKEPLPKNTSDASQPFGGKD